MFSVGMALSMAIAAPGETPRYRIQAGDTLDVQYRLTPEFNATAAVQPDGSVILPLVGRIPVSGATVEEVAGLIRPEAAKRLREPEITVVLRDYTKPSYTVAGEVGKPGSFDHRGEITLMRALAAAGWFKENSRHSQVILVRRLDRDWGEARVFNVKRSIGRQDFAEDPRIEPGDMIVVPHNTVGKFERYFRWAA
ncbi:MAG: polysaccharide biosynthesis/export family protein, partial [Bryobacteraceae bacterium]|nr:polysaccharide biosynthesis/export family protein [Bryobacteraceae bacterium]